MFALEIFWLIAKSVWENLFEIPSTNNDKCELTFRHIIRHASISKTPLYKDILVPLRPLNCDKRSDNFSILCLTWMIQLQLPGWAAMWSCKMTDRQKMPQSDLIGQRLYIFGSSQNLGLS